MPALNDPTGGSVAPSSSAVLNRTLYSKTAELVVKGYDNYLVTDTNDEILDTTAGPGVTCLGHSNKEVHQAIVDQMQKISYVYSGHNTTQPTEDLAAFLIEESQGAFAKVLFNSGGSEATETAMKIVRQYSLAKSLSSDPPTPVREHIISRFPSYHGNTLGALAVSGHPLRKGIFTPYLSAAPISFVSTCYPYRQLREGETEEELCERLLKELEAEFEKHEGNVAAFWMEPVTGTSQACTPPLKGYIPGVKKICKKYGALLVMDEILCGMGRTGYLFAWMHEGSVEEVAPDLLTCAKALGGGYGPISAVLMTAEIAQVLTDSGGYNGGFTYQSHTLACTASLCVQRIMKRDNLLENVKKMGDLMFKLLGERLTDAPFVGEIRGRGLQVGLEFVKDRKTKEPFPAETRFAGRLLEHAWDEERLSMLLGMGTVHEGEKVTGDTILLLPMYIITEVEVRQIVERLSNSIEAVSEIVMAELK
ncbi:hypothetical protein H072_3078 [Dactylellina haptotyla CBS 200.50]|uniref:Aminotransferase n=1 Tax=Dactylellina haptotyla (strain CBS 200.50) TaxID=1284197 RepID=S8APB6_DACHA|nr:hypothetical protein H072_3078 [Dactylellina haptotyla CBS 200.50]